MESPSHSDREFPEHLTMTRISQTGLLSNTDSQIIQIMNCVILCSIIGGFGIVANIINISVFIKQGLNTTINISFFALALSDLSSLVFQQWFNICVNPLFKRSDILVVPAEVQYTTGGVPRVTSARITFVVTAYVTAERCLCVAFPLHIKQIITPRRTTIIIFLIYCVTISMSIPVYCANRIQWKFYPDRNKTLLGLVTTPDRDAVEQMVYISMAVVGIISFISVVVFTGILIVKLNQKNKWRHVASASTKQSASISSRDRKTVNLVVLIASVLIISNTPGILLFVTTFFVPEFAAAGKYSNLFFASWSFSFVFEAINSSINIFLYYKMSSKYRDTLCALFPACGQTFVDSLAQRNLPSDNQRLNTRSGRHCGA